MSYQGIRERLPHMVAGDEDMTASPGECVRRMLRNLISIGASRSNNMRDGSYSLLRCALELMMEVNASDTMQYAFMLSRIYLQLNINQNEVRALLVDQVNNPGLADQVKSSFIVIIKVISLIQGDFFNWASPENVSRLAPPQICLVWPPLNFLSV